MPNIEKRADRFVRRIFRREQQQEQPKSPDIIDLRARLQKRRAQALRTRRGL